MALLCLNICGRAQITKPLKIGDKLPLSFWQQEHATYKNGSMELQNLTAYKGKLIVLDFWATWCGTCVGKMPLIDSLQKENKELKIILVSSTTVKEKPTAIQTFFSKSPVGSKHPMASIVGDTVLTKMFPFKVVPHLVWIDVTGMVIAISTYHLLDRNIIATMLKQQERLPKKQQP